MQSIFAFVTFTLTKVFEAETLPSSSFFNFCSTVKQFVSRQLSYTIQPFTWLIYIFNEAIEAEGKPLWNLCLLTKFLGKSFFRKVLVQPSSTFQKQHEGRHNTCLFKYSNIQIGHRFYLGKPTSFFSKTLLQVGMSPIGLG